MDGIIHSPDKLVLCVGRFVDEAPYTHRVRLDEGLLPEHRERGPRTTSTTPDYFFRYDRGVTNVHPKSFLGRLLFGKLMRLGHDAADRRQAATSCSRRERADGDLDVFLPFSKVAGVPRRGTQREFGLFPLWCVPYKRVRDYEWLDDSFYAGMQDELFLDLAIYGMEQTGRARTSTG